MWREREAAPQRQADAPRNQSSCEVYIHSKSLEWRRSSWCNLRTQLQDSEGIVHVGCGLQLAACMHHAASLSSGFRAPIEEYVLPTTYSRTQNVEA